jgi:putative glycosyltransferase (TIGR04372 family)
MASLPVRALRPIIKVRLVRFHTPYGFMLRCPLYYLLQREEERNNRRRFFDVVFWSGETPDLEFSQFWQRQIPLLPEFLHRKLWKFLHVIAWYWERNDSMKEHVFDLSLGKNHASDSMNSRRYDAAKFVTRQDEIELASCLESLGVDPDAQIALIHVRNSSHDVQTASKGSYDVHCANADAGSFQSAVDFLVDQGFAVLTIGNHPTSASGLSRVVEYHKSPRRTALLDLVIGSKSQLFIGTTAGALSAVAFHFRLPALLTNHLIWNSEITAEPFGYGRAVFLLKNVWRDGVRLSQSEVMQSRLPTGDQALMEAGVSLEDNSGAEILEGLKDLLTLGIEPEPWRYVHQNEEQKDFWRIFDAHTRLERVCKEDGAIISPSFLKQNPHWLR